MEKLDHKDSNAVILVAPLLCIESLPGTIFLIVLLPDKCGTLDSGV
jgi:hypothetical protein